MKLSGIQKLTNADEMIVDYRKVMVLNNPLKPYSIVDSPLQWAVALLNEQPGVVTTDCCATHDREENPKKLFYVAFLLSDQGFDFVADVYMRFIGNLCGKPMLTMLMSQAQLTHRLRIVAREFERVGHIWTIRLPIPDTRHGPTVVACFNEALADVINDSGRGPVQCPC